MKILFILSTKGKRDEILSSPGIHVGIHTSFDHSHEGISYRILITTTSNKMFKNMGCSLIIIDKSRESDSELIIIIISFHSDEFSLGVLVYIILTVNIEIGKVLLGNEFEAIDSSEAVFSFNHYYICGL